MGVAPLHCASLTQATHIGIAAPLQTPPAQGVPEPTDVCEQTLERQRSVVHSLVSGQSESPRQATQRLDATLQKGVAPPHCALEMQATHIGIVIEPLHTPPAQEVPAAIGGLLQRPPLHTSEVHALPSTQSPAMQGTVIPVQRNQCMRPMSEPVQLLGPQTI